MATMITNLPPLRARQVARFDASRAELAARHAPARQIAAQLALADLFPDVQAEADAALADLFPALRVRAAAARRR